MLSGPGCSAAGVEAATIILVTMYPIKALFFIVFCLFGAKCCTYASTIAFVLVSKLRTSTQLYIVEE